MSKRKKWTEDEIELLRKYKGEKTNLELARMCGCSKNQVIYQMKKQNIKRSKDEEKAIWNKWAPIHQKLLYDPKYGKKEAEIEGRDEHGKEESAVDPDELFKDLLKK